MGPGPARGGADDAPFSPYVQSLIQRKASQLCRKRCFSGADQRDLIQELTGRLIAKASKYDPGRGASLDTFANRVIESEVKMLLRDAGRQKRAAGHTASSLDGDNAVVGGKPVPLTEVVTDHDRHRLTGGVRCSSGRYRGPSRSGSRGSGPPAALGRRSRAAAAGGERLGRSARTRRQSKADLHSHGDDPGAA